MTAEIGNLVTLLTPAEAAKHLAISTRQLRDLTQNGSICYVNIGHGIGRRGGITRPTSKPH